MPRRGRSSSSISNLEEAPRAGPGLLERETLDGEEIHRILATRPFQEAPRSAAPA
jgi:hypothetical protein